MQINKKTKPIILALLVSLTLSIPILPKHAEAGGIPVIDVSNLSQTTISALQNIAAVLKQIEQYQTQLKQYENQLRNTVAPAAYIWDEANRTINDMNRAIQKLKAYRQQLGDVQSLLKKYQSSDFYKNSPCYSPKGCTALERAKLEKNRDEISKLQKLANDGLIQAIDSQSNTIQQDANTLQRLQRSAQSATGQMESLQYANQFNSALANQMLQLRNLMAVQMQAEAVVRQAEIDKKAREEAASKVFWGK